jgi:cytoskeletal protein CcmA (bactofilin family)
MAAEQTDTTIGAGVELKGSLHNKGPIAIHGKIIGDVVSDGAIMVGETAVVQGPITAKSVDVSGQVHGSITAEEQIELQPKSMVKGDLTTSRLSIKPGALFVGKSQMNGGKEAVVETPETEKKKPRLEIE